MRNAYTSLVGKPGGKRQLGRRSHRYEDNIKMDLREKCGRVWTACIWLTTGTSGGLL
jgi:hypothetical protein